MTCEITETEDVLYGPWRAPTNPGQETTGNVHSETTSRDLGFRGGLVAGSIHMEMFPPLLLRAFGERWQEDGGLSLYFLYPTLHGEEVRAAVAKPDPGDSQTGVFAERPDGTKICEGTASVGRPSEPSALSRRELSPHGAGELRILKGIEAGQVIAPIDGEATEDYQDERLAVITEPMDCYRNADRWGGAVATPAVYVRTLMQGVRTQAQMGDPAAIGLFGAIEIRNVNGPMVLGRKYKLGGSILATGDSPKTEYYWFDSYADDEQGRRVAEMRMMLRFMKKSSALYPELATAPA